MSTINDIRGHFFGNFIMTASKIGLLNENHSLPQQGISMSQDRNLIWCLLETSAVFHCHQQVSSTPSTHLFIAEMESECLALNNKPVTLWQACYCRGVSLRLEGFSQDQKRQRPASLRSGVCLKPILVKFCSIAGTIAI